MQSPRDKFCQRIFYALLAQIIFLLIWSLVVQSGPLLVHASGFGFDFRDFYDAAAAVLHHLDPYVKPRFNKPPLVIAMMLPFTPLPVVFIAALFFLFNLTVVPFSVYFCARRLSLSQACTTSLIWITLIFYPFYFLLERGNLDGLVLGCLCWAFWTERKNLRPILIAIGAAIKIYPLLLIAPALRNKRWGFAATLVAVTVPLFFVLPQYFVPFVHSILYRTTTWQVPYNQIENMSPGGFLIVLFGQHAGEIIFYLFWASTLGLMLYKQNQADMKDMIIPFLPWMAAFPSTVVVYTAILFLPVLAWKLHEMGDGRPTLSDKIFALGFFLVGFQTTAFCIYFEHEAPTGLYNRLPHPYFQWLNSIGTTLVLISMVLHKSSARKQSDSAEINKFQAA